MSLDQIAAVLLPAAFLVSLGTLVVYCMCQAYLAKLYRRAHRAGGPADELKKIPAIDEWPSVTVQLPIYNELFVIERLIDAVAAFDYPRDRFEIQVVDDSNDETVGIAARKIAEVQERDPDLKISHVRRGDRIGYKAGALGEALKSATGELVAIFDADFIPKPDFLRQTVPHFDAENVAVVQARWEHINVNYSLLTQMQAFLIDAHFSCEQQGRQEGDYFRGFNGTAGLWRVSAIEDAGGWQHDTITEDTDLSYRAQLKGWRIKYLEHLAAPSEVPATMDAVRSQQFRWTKGIAQVSKKILPQVWRSREPLPKKIQATSHLLMSSVCFASVLLGLAGFPSRILLEYRPDTLPIFIACMVLGVIFQAGLLFFLWTTRMNREPLRGIRRVLRFAWQYPVFLSYSVGMSIHNAFAASEGFLGIESPFVRTPKLSVTADGQVNTQGVKYLTRSLPRVFFIELAMVFYFIAACVYGAMLLDVLFIGFQAQLAFSFGLICYFTISSRLQIAGMQRGAAELPVANLSNEKASESSPVRSEESEPNNTIDWETRSPEPATSGSSIT